MNRAQVRQIIREEIKNALNENIGDILGYTALAIILGGSAYITYINNIKGNIAQSARSGQLNPLFKKILDKVAPNWIKNREIRAISHKLSKIPEVMRIVNTPNKTGLRDELVKYLTPEEKQYLRDLTRTTIRNASEIKEIAPSEFLKNKFPHLIEYDRNRMGSEMKWILTSTEQVDKNQIADFQASAGYAPQGYGGPFKFQEKTLPNGTFEYTWTCYSSSD